ncbi:MAG: hypothetical protein AAFY28_20525, partial [Actinomycetota bacterium]
ADAASNTYDYVASFFTTADAGGAADGVADGVGGDSVVDGAMNQGEDPPYAETNALDLPAGPFDGADVAAPGGDEFYENNFYNPYEWDLYDDARPNYGNFSGPNVIDNYAQ